MQYLLDSDWAIHYMRGASHVVHRLNKLFPQGVGISIIAVAELYEGLIGAIRPDDAESNMQRLLSQVEPIVPLSQDICWEFARQRSRLRAEGNIIGDMDILIGSTAIVHGVTLLTNNRRHFERLQGLTLISL